MKAGRFGWLGMALLAGVLGLASGARASQGPLEVVRAGTERVLAILEAYQPGQAISVRAHREEILDIVHDYFDFREMAMRSLGPQWKKLSSAERDEFVDAFERLLFDNYVDRVDTYTRADEQVVFDGEEIREPYAQVKSRVVGYRDGDATVDYRLKRKSEGWMVYDVVVEGVSLVNNYRSQFNSILARKSFEQLLTEMREKKIRVD